MTPKEVIKCEKEHLKTLIKRVDKIRTQKEVNLEDLTKLHLLEIDIYNTRDVISYYQLKLKESKDVRNN